MGIRSFSRPLRQPPRSRRAKRLAWTVIAAAAVLFVATVARNLQRHDSLTAWRRDLEVAAGRPAWPEWSAEWSPLPTPPQHRHGLPQDLHGPYAYAARNPQLLKHIPCYCGCVREGHQSNLNCFVTSFRADGTPVWTAHSFNCPMCVDIAREVMLMTSQGMPLQQVREEIDRRYRVLGEATHTPLPIHLKRGQ